MENQIQKARQLPNKMIYAAFLIVAIIFSLRSDFSTAVIFGGIGLAFDPFNQSVSFGKRPLWQKLWLIAHIAFVISIVVITIRERS